jgi:hypothetical protein
MNRRLTQLLTWVISVLLISIVSPLESHAATPTIYESMSSTDGATMNAVAGSSDSLGLSGNWLRVPGLKSGTGSFGASIYKSGYNSQLAFPTNSTLTLPASNTAAGTTSNSWTVFGSARSIATPISFDAASTFYFSFLMYAPDDGWGNWGSAVAGLIDALPTSNSDTTKKSLYFGRTYGGTAIIKLASANLPVWEAGGTAVNGPSVNSTAPGNKSWFVIVKITSAASGNDSVQIKLFSPSGTIPTTESGITWDATLSTPITGTWGYLAVQTEYNGLIDEIRGGISYNGVAGFSSPATLGAPSISGSVQKGVSSTITVGVNAPGFVRFFVDGKRIPNCQNVATSGSSPNFSASCTWKPATQGTRIVSASFTPSDLNFLAAVSSPAIYFISNRTNRR